MTVHVGDLKNQTGEPGPHPVLHCRICGETNSANLSDYFQLPEHHIFRHCGTEMDLVMKKTVYEKVRLPGDCIGCVGLSHQENCPKWKLPL